MGVGATVGVGVAIGTAVCVGAGVGANVGDAIGVAGWLTDADGVAVGSEAICGVGDAVASGVAIVPAPDVGCVVGVSVDDDPPLHPADRTIATIEALFANAVFFIAAISRPACTVMSDL